MMDEDTKRSLRLFSMKLDELADKQEDTVQRSGDGEYSRGARDAYRDAARRLNGLIVRGAFDSTV